MNEVILSAGGIPWLGLINSVRYAKSIGFDGVEVVPSRKITNEINKLINKFGNSWTSNVQDFNLIKGIHQNWRLDIGLDKSYGIKVPTSILFNILRLALFPHVDKTNGIIIMLSEKLNLPVTTHDISKKWTDDGEGKPFSGGILYEVIGTKITPIKLKEWMKEKNHNIIVDLRDDQSMAWAKKYGFNDWEEFWKWIGLEKIKGIQLTLIGSGSLTKIINHKDTPQEEQLLWLYKNKWKGNVVVEANPLTLFLACHGNLRRGFEIINQFVRRTLIKGKKWSE